MNKLVILGPTASGKTRLAVKLAHELNGEIISADSRQLYRGMDLGTGKDLAEYTVDSKSVQYHLIDTLDAGEKYNVHRFQQDCEAAITDIDKREKQVIICGGTGLYLDAILKDYQFTSIPVNLSLRQEIGELDKQALLNYWLARPSAYTELADTSTRKRLIRAIEIAEFLTKNADFKIHPKSVTGKFIVIGLNPEVEVRRQRITKRLHERMHQGLIDEVKTLLSSGLTAEQLIYYGLEYKYITLYLIGELTYATMLARLETEIHRFAKRQMTFFRKMERDGINIHWLQSSPESKEGITEILATISNSNSLQTT